ncbi:MAG: ribonuclease HII, partial [Opitutales bacterium]|nr:ribonuclease HII [Opitutales bacterium]
DFEASFASVEEIERLNIVGATKLAMARAVSAVNARGCLNLAPSCAPATLFGEGDADISRADVLIDGIPLKNFPYRHLAVVKGDAQSLAIAAASIVAKVVRDDFMDELALKYPRYGFEIHKGYGTPAHRQNILIYGACAAHRPSYLKKLRANTKNIPQQISLF